MANSDGRHTICRVGLLPSAASGLSTQAVVNVVAEEGPAGVCAWSGVA
jgi:hypothetical protein